MQRKVSEVNLSQVTVTVKWPDGTPESDILLLNLLQTLSQRLLARLLPAHQLSLWWLWWSLDPATVFTFSWTKSYRNRLVQQGLDLLLV